MRIGKLGERLALLLLAAVAGAAVAFSGVGAVIDRTVDPLRFALLSRPASGRTVIVEVDAASIARLSHWPWSRAEHAALVDRLRRAGAGSVTFDVDFSSALDSAGDTALAAALARADGLVALPTFGQVAGADDGRTLDRAPLAQLRPHVMLASVSIAPDADGIVRQAPFATMTQGIPHPSLSAYIARRSGEADSFFPIDFSIDPNTIPRLSFVAVRDGRFDPAVVRGRDVLVGATAIELGDRYATPRWGVIPGVVVQALGAETLRAGLPTDGGDAPALVLAVLLAALLLAVRRTSLIPPVLAGTIVMLMAAALAGQAGAQRTYPIGAALTVLLLVAAGRAGQIAANRLREQRLTDEATGLPNRAAMIDAPASGDLIAVAQLAGLETITAVIGANRARDVLLEVVERLRTAAADGQVYRLADRSFGFAPRPDTDVAALFAPLHGVMHQPFGTGGRRVDVQVAIGVADARGGMEDALANAALAADEALGQGVFWRRFETDISVLERRLTLMGELDEALRSGGVEVHYQPKLALREGRITSAEALVRWNHARLGAIGPGEFIPLAEQSDRIAPLTLFVVERVMRDVAQWRSLGHPVTAAVNISAKLVASTTFNGQLRALIDKGALDPRWLVFEVTESATLDDPEGARRALQFYRNLGIAISLDDYGTGQSTLTYLRELPLSELKIDRSFVQHAHVNRNDGLLVRSTIELAHDLGLRVVAEGIEDEGCLTFLREVGCDYAQGYFVSRPLPLDRFLALLDADKAVETERVAA